MRVCTYVGTHTSINGSSRQFECWNRLETSKKLGSRGWAKGCERESEMIHQNALADESHIPVCLLLMSEISRQANPSYNLESEEKLSLRPQIHSRSILVSWLARVQNGKYITQSNITVTIVYKEAKPKGPPFIGPKTLHVWMGRSMNLCPGWDWGSRKLGQEAGKGT